MPEPRIQRGFSLLAIVFLRHCLWTDCEFSETQGWNFKLLPVRHKPPNLRPGDLYSSKRPRTLSDAISPKISTFPGYLLLLLVLYVFYLV